MKRFVLGFLAIVISGCGTPPPEETVESPQDIPAAVSTKQAKLAAAGQAAVAQEQSRKFIEKGLEQLKQSKIQDAIKSFDEAIKASPRDLRGYVVLGQTYLRSRNYDRAIDTFTAATHVAPQDGEVYFMLATSYQLAGKKEQAIKSVQRSAEIFQQKKDQANFRKAVMFMQSLIKPAPAEQKS